MDDGQYKYLVLILEDIRDYLEDINKALSQITGRKDEE